VARPVRVAPAVGERQSAFASVNHSVRFGVASPDIPTFRG